MKIIFICLFVVLFFLTNQNKINDNYSNTFNQIKEITNKILSTQNISDIGSIPFVNSKKSIKKTPIFSLIKKLPKGALLHIHSSALLDPLSFIKTFTNNTNIYINPENFYLIYALNPPKNFVNFLQYKKNLTDPLKIVRLYRRLANKISVTKNEIKYTFRKSSSDFWDLFDKKSNYSNFMNSDEIFWSYLEKGLKKQFSDNILHIEIKHLFGIIQKADGNYLSIEEEMEKFYQILSKFEKTYKKSVRIIYCALRFLDEKVIEKDLENAIKLRTNRKYRKYLIGFDLVQNEDLKALENFEKVFTIIKKQLEDKYKNKINLYFHAGETLNVTNNNIEMAVRLGTKRIGHGVNFHAHLKLLEDVRKKNICVEVCPISNQIINYVKNIQNSQAILFLQENIPFVISSDDPMMFKYSSN